jgi:hypothetical protein
MYTTLIPEYIDPMSIVLDIRAITAKLEFVHIISPISFSVHTPISFAWLDSLAAILAGVTDARFVIPISDNCAHVCHHPIK